MGDIGEVNGKAYFKAGEGKDGYGELLDLTDEIVMSGCDELDG